jgi:hypothetical protein
MSTRISYIKSKTTLRSPFYKNFEGTEYQVVMTQHDEVGYNAYILDRSGDCLDHMIDNDLSKLKRVVRERLINVYNINFNEELRGA